MEPEVKAEAEKILDECGLSASDDSIRPKLSLRIFGV